MKYVIRVDFYDPEKGCHDYCEDEVYEFDFNSDKAALKYAWEHFSVFNWASSWLQSYINTGHYRRLKDVPDIRYYVGVYRKNSDSLEKIGEAASVWVHNVLKDPSLNFYYYLGK